MKERAKEFQNGRAVSGQPEDCRVVRQPAGGWSRKFRACLGADGGDSAANAGDGHAPPEPVRLMYRHFSRVPGLAVENWA
jgi:hypothetical protein